MTAVNGTKQKAGRTHKVSQPPNPLDNYWVPDHPSLALFNHVSLHSPPRPEAKTQDRLFVDPLNPAPWQGLYEARDPCHANPSTGVPHVFQHQHPPTHSTVPGLQCYHEVACGRQRSRGDIDVAMSSNLAGQITDDPVINAESKVGTVIAICVSFSVASAFFVALRLYTRVGLLHHAGGDDVTIVVAEILALLTALGAGMGEWRWVQVLVGSSVDNRGQKRDMAWVVIPGLYPQRMLCSNSR